MNTTGVCGGWNFDQLAGFYIVDEAVDRDRLRHEWAGADAGDVSEHGLGLIFDGEEFYKLGCGGAWAFAYVLEAFGSEGCGFEALGE